MKFEEVKLYSPGLLLFDIPDTIFLPFQKLLVEKNLSDFNNVKWNHQLAGQIEHEYQINCPGNLKFFLLEAATNFQTFYGKGLTKEKIVIENFWANYQKKYEYNPIHAHTGDLSFIIFVQIPFLFENEDKLNNTINARRNLNGRISFTYQTFFDNMANHAIQADKRFEGKMLMFPNTAHHAVHPFYTSDDYRITVSGNMKIMRD